MDAPWAFSAGEPELDSDCDGAWSRTCETLPEYEAGATYQLDFCRSRSLLAGEVLTFDAFAGGKVDIFMKRVASQGASVALTVLEYQYLILYYKI